MGFPSWDLRILWKLGWSFGISALGASALRGVGFGEFRVLGLGV